MLGRVTVVGAIMACGAGSNDGGPEAPAVELSVKGGGNNVPTRYSSDLWVHGAYAYTGTWGATPRDQARGDLVNIWALDAGGAPTLVDSIKIAGAGNIGDLQVTEDGSLLVVGTERGTNNGLYLYDLADPRAPALLDTAMVSQGFHTTTVADIGGRRYVFAARNPANPALMIYDITTPNAIALATTVPVPPNYGIHDTYVRDGLAFVFAWNTGVIIYDVGNGIKGGSPVSPQEVSRLVTASNRVPGGPAAHNGWWFHNPVTGEHRYLFVGQEGPQRAGVSSSGDIHVVDVSDLEHPSEVAFFHMVGAGTHNFWMDESRQVLYAAYYNGGVVALDVSGTLSGDLSDRLLAKIQPGGEGNTYTWGVQLAGGSLYAIDMLSGLWELAVP